MIIDTGVNPNSIENESLDTVYIQDFGDRYHVLDEEREWNELERKARAIKRRYRNIREYNEAVNIYCEYMANLSISYGRRELFNLALRAGNVTEFIPPFPRLKQTKANKTRLKKGIMDSAGDGRMLDEKEADEYIQRIIEEEDIELYDPNDDVALMPLSIKKVHFLEDEALDVVVNNGRRIFDSSARMTEVDYLEEYFRAKNIMTSKKKKKKKGEDEDKLYGHELFYHMYDTEDVVEEDETMWYEGSIMTRSEIDEVKMLRQLKELGWDSLKLMNGVRKGSNSNPTIRHMKNIDKMEKKNKKKKKKSNNLVTQILTDNKFDSFEDFERSMLSFGGFDNE